MHLWELTYSHHRARVPTAPCNGDQRKFEQLYILGPDEATAQRMQLAENRGCDADLMQDLSHLMATINPLADACKMAVRGRTGKHS